MENRFANSDYALAMAVRNHKPTDDFTFKLQIEIDDVDQAATYDIACAYVVNLESRFEKHFPDVLESIKKMRWGVPALHVQGHQDSAHICLDGLHVMCGPFSWGDSRALLARGKSIGAACPPNEPRASSGHHHQPPRRLEPQEDYEDR